MARTISKSGPKPGSPQAPGSGRKTHMTPQQAASLNPTGITGPKARTPETKREIASIMADLEFEPLVEIVEKLRMMEARYYEVKDTLDFKTEMQFFQTFNSQTERLMSYVYTRKGLEFRSEKTNVNVDYNSMLDQLNSKVFAPEVNHKMDKAIDQYSKKVEAQVSKASTSIMVFDNDTNGLIIEHNE